MEGFLETVAAFAHGLGANRDADFDATGYDLVGDVLDGFEAGRAEAVHGGAASGGGVAGCEGGGTADVGCFAVADLYACEY